MYHRRKQEQRHISEGHDGLGLAGAKPDILRHHQAARCMHKRTQERDVSSFRRFIDLQRDRGDAAGLTKLQELALRSQKSALKLFSRTPSPSRTSN